MGGADVDRRGALHDSVAGERPNVEHLFDGRQNDELDAPVLLPAVGSVVSGNRIELGEAGRAPVRRGQAAATLCLGLFARFSKHPVRNFTILAAIFFFTSIQAPRGIEGAKPQLVLSLMLMHIATAVIS